MMNLKYLEKYETLCQCGCGITFLGTATYRTKGGGLSLPEYHRGHNPNCRNSQFGEVTAWNKGLRKGDHPSIDRMGYQPGHKPYNDWSHVNAMLKENPDVRAKWLASKKGQVAWNKGLTVETAPQLYSGERHHLYKGGSSRPQDSGEMKKFRVKILKRDNYTCQECGDRNHKGRGSRINLEVHHIKSAAEHPDLFFDPSNVVLLCRSCHFKTHNFGGKNISSKRKGSSG